MSSGQGGLQHEHIFHPTFLNANYELVTPHPPPDLAILITMLLDATLKLDAGSWLGLRLSQSRGRFAKSFYYDPASCPLEPGNLPPATSICKHSAGSVLAPDCHEHELYLSLGFRRLGTSFFPYNLQQY